MRQILLPTLLLFLGLAACADHGSIAIVADGPEAPINEPDTHIVDPGNAGSTANQGVNPGNGGQGSNTGGGTGGATTGGSNGGGEPGCALRLYVRLALSMHEVADTVIRVLKKFDCRDRCLLLQRSSRARPCPPASLARAVRA